MPNAMALQSLGPSTITIKRVMLCGVILITMLPSRTFGETKLARRLCRSWKAIYTKFIYPTKEDKSDCERACKRENKEGRDQISHILLDDPCVVFDIWWGPSGNLSPAAGFCFISDWKDMNQASTSSAGASSSTQPGFSGGPETAVGKGLHGKGKAPDGDSSIDGFEDTFTGHNIAAELGVGFHPQQSKHSSGMKKMIFAGLHSASTLINKSLKMVMPQSKRKGKRGPLCMCTIDVTIPKLSIDKACSAEKTFPSFMPGDGWQRPAPSKVDLVSRQSLAFQHIAELLIKVWPVGEGEMTNELYCSTPLTTCSCLYDDKADDAPSRVAAQLKHGAKCLLTKTIADKVHNEQQISWFDDRAGVDQELSRMRQNHPTWFRANWRQYVVN
jgi:hypothetical protein